MNCYDDEKEFAMAEALKMVQNRSTGVSVILCFAKRLEQWTGAYEVRCETHGQSSGACRNITQARKFLYRPL